MKLLNKVLWWLVFAALFVAGWAAAPYLVDYFARQAVTDTFTNAEPAKAVKSLPTVSIPIKTVKVYTKAAKSKLNLPAEVKADTSAHVAAATVIQPEDRPVMVTTLIDSDTGMVTIMTGYKPRPWIAFRKSGAAGIGYDLLSRRKELYVRQDFIQSKALVLGGRASIDTDRDIAAMLTLEFRW